MRAENTKIPGTRQMTECATWGVRRAMCYKCITSFTRCIRAHNRSCTSSGMYVLSDLSKLVQAFLVENYKSTSARQLCEFNRSVDTRRYNLREPFARFPLLPPRLATAAVCVFFAINRSFVQSARRHPAQPVSVPILQSY